MTSIRPEQPPVYFKWYPTQKENGQDSLEHTDFFASALEDGRLQDDYDVIIQDNWAGQVGAAGMEVTDALEDLHGIAMIPLPARFSKLNGPIEMGWRIGKARAKSRNAFLQNIDPGMTPYLMAQALESITYADMAALYTHSGYKIEQPALAELLRLDLL